MLVVRGLEAAYGPSQVLFGVDLEVGAGEVATLLGRNGMGKTTTVRAIMGILPPRAGAVELDGRALGGLPSYQIAQAGIGLVPEGRQVFPTLTVEENLVATAAHRTGAGEPWTVARVYALFPQLAARQHALGALLSGGEQQMLAIGRALMTNPRLLVLDEATEGLAPLVRADIWRCLGQLKTAGQAILVIDKHSRALGRLADRYHVIEKGRIVWRGTPQDFARDPALEARYLGV